ncbi:glycosyltransferase family 2 protein [Accumulibacter sp.]|uniref:glycosyltransferase family 2 protein n=1 Tax=Accumulibacter sp. TaxID=2053492 RepID=UPI0025E5C991|nr:glycosyltransferase family 2 protein [Accumulibacter sp.]MCM8624878.1 glycosyltransferase [Accumulibacter sp.]
MKASVIIPTRNRADVLVRCLAALTRQTLPRDEFEVLVVDNGSIDNTCDVAKVYGQSLQLTYVTAPEPGLHVGRHAGLLRAKADILIFADDDIEALPTWVEAVVDSFKDTSVALVGGNNYPLFEDEPPAWLLRWWQRPVQKGRAMGSLSILDFGEGIFEISPGYVWGCNFSIKRHVLLTAGGFHPDGVPKERLRYRGDGETHVSNVVGRLGMRTLFNSLASVRHQVSKSRMTKGYFEQRGFAQGISDSFTAIRHWGGATLPLSQQLRWKLAPLRSAIRSSLRSVAAADSVERERLAVEQAMAIAYQKGYEFHRREVLADSELLTWVLKENYL